MRKRHGKKSSGIQQTAPTTTSLPYVSRTHLLTAGERRFYHQGLASAIGDRYLISFKVRLADVITAENWESKHGRRIAQKHLDFVLMTPKTTRIVAAIELNDASHDASSRQLRDEFLFQALHSAGIPLISFRVYRAYDFQKIRHRIFAAIVTNRRHHSARSR